MQKLYFVRHGESADNAADLWSRDETALTARGRSQAKTAGQDAQRRGIRFDLIIASPLPRALETARIIAREAGYPTDSIEVNPLFVERSFGALTGGTHSSFWSKHILYSDIDQEEGAETVKALQERSARALTYLRERPEAVILVVGHGVFGRALRRVIKGEPYSVEYASDTPTNQLANAEILELI